MRAIRRFQRTMITVLVGINILVFSTSFYGDFSAALVQSIISMVFVSLLIVAYSYFVKLEKRKKSFPSITNSKEN